MLERDSALQSEEWHLSSTSAIITLRDGGRNWLPLKTVSVILHPYHISCR